MAMTQDFLTPEAVLRGQAKADGMTHITTGIAIAREGKILAVRRAADDYFGGTYELPGGGVDGNETLAASVAREAFEETGLRVRAIRGMFAGFDYTTPKKPQVRQFNFLVEAAGEVRLSEEHDQYVWLTQEESAATPMTDAMHACFLAGFRALGGA